MTTPTYRLTDLPVDIRAIAIHNVGLHAMYMYRKVMATHRASIRAFSIHRMINSPSRYRELANRFHFAKTLLAGGDVAQLIVADNQSDFLADGTYVVYTTLASAPHSVFYKNLV